MRKFEPLTLDVATLSTNLSELEDLLGQQSRLKERDALIPFFKGRPHLCAALGYANNAVELPDRWANELSLFGDFVCDVAAGDSEANAFTLIEFEDAYENSIFSALKEGKAMRRWSSRFERGFSQLVDWAWRLSTETEASTAFRRTFGDNNPAIHFVLVIGRDADMSKDDLMRLRWRANKRVSRTVQNVLLYFRRSASLHTASSIAGCPASDLGMRAHMIIPPRPARPGRGSSSA